MVADKLAADWAPEQIAGWLKVSYAGDPEMQVSHETIYRSLFVQSRGVLKKALIQHLRRRRTMRRSQHASNRGQRRGQIVDAISISERPAIIEDRAVPGHWEGDLLAGAAQSHVATLVERQSRYLMLVRVPGKDTTSVVRALSRHVRTLPRGLMASLTWDRGAELAAHKRFTIATNVQVYFCDPQSPWQRGSNENTNGLRGVQYFPTGSDLSAFSQPELNRIAVDEINVPERPSATTRLLIGWRPSLHRPVETMEVGVSAALLAPGSVALESKILARALDALDAAHVDVLDGRAELERIAAPHDDVGRLADRQRAHRVGHAGTPRQRFSARRAAPRPTQA